MININDSNIAYNMGVPLFTKENSNGNGFSYNIPYRVYVGDNLSYPEQNVIDLKYKLKIRKEYRDTQRMRRYVSGSSGRQSLISDETNRVGSGVITYTIETAYPLLIDRRTSFEDAFWAYVRDDYTSPNYKEVNDALAVTLPISVLIPERRKNFSFADNTSVLSEAETFIIRVEHTSVDADGITDVASYIFYGSPTSRSGLEKDERFTSRKRKNDIVKTGVSTYKYGSSADHAVVASDTQFYRNPDSYARPTLADYIHEVVANNWCKKLAEILGVDSPFDVTFYDPVGGKIDYVISSAVLPIFEYAENVICEPLIDRYAYFLPDPYYADDYGGGGMEDGDYWMYLSSGSHTENFYAFYNGSVNCAIIASYLEKVDGKYQRLLSTRKRDASYSILENTNPTYSSYAEWKSDLLQTVSPKAWR